MRVCCRLLPPRTDRGVAFESVIDNLGRAMPDPASGLRLRMLVDDSEAAGDGGVTASDVADETDFAGGVVAVGEEADVAEDRSDPSGGRETERPVWKGPGIRRRVESVSDLRSFS